VLELDDRAREVRSSHASTLAELSG
jgi:hypothetical protein